MKLPLAIENLVKKLGIRPSGSSSLTPRKSEPDRLAGERNDVNEAITAESFENFVKQASSPLSQLILQLHVAGKAGALLSASDVLIHVKRLITILEKNGMTIVGQPDQVLPFDPTSHEPVDGSSYPNGLTVRVRFPGLAYGSVIVRKAAVEKQETQ